MVPLDDCREPVFNTPEHQNLYAEVMALPAKYRLPLYLYYYEGYTAAEVGSCWAWGPPPFGPCLRAAAKGGSQCAETGEGSV